MNEVKENILDKIKILYEDDEVVVISKPKKLMVHPDGKRDEVTLVDWILEKYSQINIGNVGESILLNNGDIIKRPGIVHRLDKNTSGILILAKSQESFNNLKKQFQEKEIEKKYLAIVYGDVKYDFKKIYTDIGRSKNDFRKWTAHKKAIRGKSREAITEYKVLKRIVKNNQKFTILELSSKTGRTHQLRVHMQYDNHPIVGDVLYAGKKFDKENNENNLFFDSQALHAYKISWKNLENKKKEVIDYSSEIEEKWLS